MRLLRSFGFAWSGLLLAFKKEANLRIQSAIFLATVFAGFLFQISHFEWLVILLCGGFVCALEILNSALEKMCNFVQPDVDPAIKHIKDLSAGAVLFASIIAAIAGIIIFLPRMMAIL